jgi:hypothetical protein
MQGFLFSPPRSRDHIERLLVLDDEQGVNWLGVPFAEQLAQPLDLGAVEKSDRSILLSELCSGKPVDGRQEEIEQLLSTLMPPQKRVAARSNAASLRIAVGSVAGLVPITTGLAAAHALPAPVEHAVSSALGTAGVQLPERTANDGSVLLADPPVGTFGSVTRRQAADGGNRSGDVHGGSAPKGGGGKEPSAGHHSDLTPGHGEPSSNARKGDNAAGGGNANHGGNEADAGGNANDGGNEVDNGSGNNGSGNSNNGNGNSNNNENSNNGNGNAYGHSDPNNGHAHNGGTNANHGSGNANHGGGNANNGNANGAGGDKSNNGGADSSADQHANNKNADTNAKQKGSK